MKIENVDIKNTVLSQPMLIVAIMNEIATQMPSATVSNAQFKEVVKSANKLVAVFKHEQTEQAGE